MEFSWPIFLTGIVLGILQLSVGVVVGRALPLKRSRPTPPAPVEVDRLQKFTNRLYRLVTNVANDVGHHQVRIEQMSKDLASIRNTDRPGITDYVLHRVSQIVEINEHLQNRLKATEGKLQTQAQQLELHIVEARTDPVTRLPNRRAFDDELARRIDAWRRRQSAFCLIMVDADGFKSLNDRYGHPAGDFVLRSIAEVLDNELDVSDIAARFGGDEFAVILSCNDLTEAKRKTERIRESVAHGRFVFDQATLQLTVSVGLAVVRTGDNPARLIKRADEALYTSKRATDNWAYYHNGSECRPIGPDVRPEAEYTSETAAEREDTPNIEAEEDPELQAICEDLRTRLAEVADDGGGR